MPRGKARGGGSSGGGSSVRGGRTPKQTTTRIGGIEIAYDDELGKHINDAKPAKLFPAYDVPQMKPLSKEEKSQVAKYRALRNRIHEGPLYTVLGENVRVKKQTGYGTSSRMVTDPFEGVETWSQRYTRRKRRLPQLNDMQFVHSLFPEELWSTLDPTLTGAGSAQKTRAERLQASSKRIAELAEQGDHADKQGPPDTSEQEDAAPQQTDTDTVDNLVDDEYATDEEDDTAGDYNGEQYFDDGGDDAGDDYGGGDGGDDVY